MPLLMPDLGDDHIRAVLSKVCFIDIETSLLQARVFRTGKQSVNAHQLTTTTRILTVAGGTMLDMYEQGKAGVWAVGNHQFKKRFKADPLDDTETLRYVWDILDKNDVIVAHHAAFDKGWLYGRFLELGWKLPSKVTVVCTYRNLHGYNLTSKKLDELSGTLCDTAKISTDFSLWMRCSEGEKAAFEEMMTYNIGDIYDTLFKVYLRTCQYYPNKSIDLTNHDLEIPQCRVTGMILEDCGVHTNHTTGKQYWLYVNPHNGLVYRDRYCTSSANADRGKVIAHI